MPAKLMQQFGLHFIFAHAGTRVLHGTAMSATGNLRRTAHDLKLFRAFEEAHLIQQKPDVTNFGQRGSAAPRLLPHPVDPADHARVPHRVVAQRAKNGRLVRQQPGQHFVQLGDGICFVELECFPGALGSVTEPIPDFIFDIFLAAKQDALRCIRTGPRHDHEYCLGLAKACQVIKIAVEAIGIMRISISHPLRRGRNDGNALPHLGCQTMAPFAEGLNGDHG